MKVLSVTVWLATASLLGYLPPFSRSTIVAQNDYLPIRARLISQINAHRHEYNLPALALDRTAQRAAQFQAEDMEAAGIMRHADSGGRSPMARYYAFGGHAAEYAENVAYYSGYTTDLREQWEAIVKLDGMMMAEKPPEDGHRQNILSPDYSAIGIGIAVGPHGIFVAEDFVGRQSVALR